MVYSAIMNITSRSYGGKLFQPTPEIFQRKDGLIVIVTSWGSKESAKHFIRIVNESYNPEEADSEVTSPFGFLTSLSPVANRLRTALLIANNQIYSEENSAEYQSGLEVLTICPDGKDLCMAQIGGPHVFMDREGASLLPLISSWDLSTEFCKKNQLPPPLPKELAGIDRGVPIHIKSVRTCQNFQLILLSRSYIPNAFYALPRQQRDLNGISEALSQSDPHCPFWLACISDS